MKLSITAALLLGTTLPSFAGGITEPVPEPVVEYAAPPLQIDGNWDGFYGGVQLGYGKLDTDIAGVDGDGALGGIHFGYLRDLGQFVAGVELDYDAANIDIDGVAGSKLDSVTRLGLKGGYDLGRTFVYGTVGAAYAKADIAGVSQSDTGYFVGIGADYALSEKWSVGGDLLYHKFDNFDSTGIDVDATTLRAKVSYRF